MACQGMSAQQAFSTDFSLMWEWEECNSFDVASQSVAPPKIHVPSRHALMFKVLFGEKTGLSKDLFQGRGAHIQGFPTQWPEINTPYTLYNI